MAALSDNDLLARLVSFDSVSSQSNVPIVDFIHEYLAESAGSTIRLERLETGDDAKPGMTSEAAKRHREESPDQAPQKLNLIVSCGPDLADNTARDGLILCGHLDVVPADEPDWQSDPFTLTESDGKLVARGAADMKGFDALAINLLLETAQRAEELTHPLLVMLTCDEEVGSLGAKHLVTTYPRADAMPRHCIIGEPTSLRAVRMHKGHLSMRITIHGKAAHSGSPHLGESAIEPAADILIALREMRQRFESMSLDVSRFFSSVPHPVLNIAAVRGGGAINVVPDCCTIDLGIRLMPGQPRDETIAEVERTAREAAQGAQVEIDLVRENPPLLTDENAPLYQTLCELLDQHDSLGVSFASDGGWLSTLGIDCVLFGPGAIEVAHKPNEALPLDEFTRARSLLQELIDRFCLSHSSRAADKRSTSSSSLHSAE